MKRRDIIWGLTTAGVGAGACSKDGATSGSRTTTTSRPKGTADEVPGSHRANPSAKTPVLKVTRLPPSPTPWPTPDPFLFCVHHDDAYPEGNEQLGPKASLANRNLGSDFGTKDGWNMYHGRVVPGFPQHPHRGFETVTVVRRGLLDHADSLGAAARYGEGDVQWLTAGSGIQHAEMFPLLKRDAPNPVELFQIWLNLPKADKMVAAHFSMLWADQVPKLELKDASGHSVHLTLVAGSLGDVVPPSPPPSSWARDPAHQVLIWAIKLAPHAEWTLPVASGVNRMLYFFQGDQLTLGAHTVRSRHAITLDATVPSHLQNGAAESELLLLQGQPIAEPVAQHGPFVMNSEEEIRRAYADYRRTAFGGWPWDRHDPVHGAEEGRFARHTDGQVERPA